MDLSTFWMFSGFLLACYSVTANDSIQTLGTFLSSNQNKEWYKLALYVSLILWLTLGWSWYVNDGDMAYGRLARIPRPDEFNIFHALAPAVLLIITQFGIPVSTTFLVLAVFATPSTVQSMVMKSAAGYAVAAVAAFVFWMILAKFLDELKRPDEKHRGFWVVVQWASTGFLWASWLMHDMANIAVYLPRKVEVPHFVFSMIMITAMLCLIFYLRGGKIQKVVLSKTSTRFIRSASIIDIVYALILWIFKEYNNVPMSTTWVFVGLLAGREAAIRNAFADAAQAKIVFPVLMKDFFKIILGLAISIVIAFVASELT